MSSPKQIHINWNASDCFDTFDEHGINATAHEIPSREQVKEVLAAQIGQFFRLAGWLDDRTVVSLKIEGETPHGLVVANTMDPIFEGSYDISDDPPPHITMQGDCVFRLVKSDLEIAT